MKKCEKYTSGDIDHSHPTLCDCGTSFYQVYQAAKSSVVHATDPISRAAVL